MAPSYWKMAARELSQRDPTLGSLIRSHRALELNSRGDAFQTLARAIVGQQISVKAAQSVWGRLAAAVSTVAPALIVGLDGEALRSCGLSARKGLYLQDLARHFLDGGIDLHTLNTRSDQELIDALTAVRGIGPWTAQMFLIFHLARPDVLPVADLGLQKAVSLHYNRGRAVSEKRIHAIARTWAPWRSVATWYLWRSLDPIAVER